MLAELMSYEGADPARGLAVVTASWSGDPGRDPETGRKDAQWIARLAEMTLLRPSFVPRPEILKNPWSGGRAPHGHFA
jgi:hypothetical protein